MGRKMAKSRELKSIVEFIICVVMKSIYCQ
jgi:hypothetical protein